MQLTPSSTSTVKGSGDCLTGDVYVVIQEADEHSVLVTWLNHVTDDEYVSRE